MKRIIALVLALMLCAALFAACGEAGTEGKSDSGKAKLVMATNAQFPPYEYHEDEKIIGIDAEIAQAIADKLDMELEISDMEFDSIIESVKSGKADIGMAGLTVTD